MQSRYYDPAVGRFVNADGIIPGVGNIQGYNLFVYCFNNPINMSDPSGRWPDFDAALTKIQDALLGRTGNPNGHTLSDLLRVKKCS